jgi:mono-ADP-ribosyltransferase sirtuin 6
MENYVCFINFELTVSVDTIIDFGEDLPELDLTRAEEESKKSDLALVLGTSLEVTPACDLPLLTIDKKKADKGKLVIVNLQKTKHDKQAQVRVFGKVDAFMKQVMGHLSMLNVIL